MAAEYRKKREDIEAFVYRENTLLPKDAFFTWMTVPKSYSVDASGDGTVSHFFIVDGENAYRVEDGWLVVKKGGEFRPMHPRSFSDEYEEKV